MRRLFRRIYPFKITNQNLKTLIHAYLANTPLPAELVGIQIGQWDVHRVTDMKYLFSKCESFNEPLNDWNVSNVTDMRNMFF